MLEQAGDSIVDNVLEGSDRLPEQLGQVLDGLLIVGKVLFHDRDVVQPAESVLMPGVNLAGSLLLKYHLDIPYAFERGLVFARF